MKRCASAILFAVLLLFGCRTPRVSEQGYTDGYYQITDSAVLGAIYVKYQVYSNDSGNLVDIISSNEICPRFIQFSKDSISWMFDGYLETGEIMRMRYIFFAAEKYCRKHNYHPWIRVPYRIEERTNKLEMEPKLWFNLRQPIQHLGYYQLCSASKNEIWIKWYFFDNKLERWLLICYRNADGYPNTLNQLPQTDDYYCCYDSLYVNIQNRIIEEGGQPYDRPVIHDHGNPDINNSSFWNNYFEK